MCGVSEQPLDSVSDGVCRVGAVSRPSRSSAQSAIPTRRVHQILRRSSGSDRRPIEIASPHCFPIPGCRRSSRVEDRPLLPTLLVIQRPVPSSWRAQDESFSLTSIPLSLIKILLPAFAFTRGMIWDVKCSWNHANCSGRIWSRNDRAKISSVLYPPSCKTKRWSSEDCSSRTSAKDASRHDLAVAIFSKIDPCRLWRRPIMHNVLINCKALLAALLLVYTH